MPSTIIMQILIVYVIYGFVWKRSEGWLSSCRMSKMLLLFLVIPLQKKCWIQVIPHIVKSPVKFSSFLSDGITLNSLSSEYSSIKSGKTGKLLHRMPLISHTRFVMLTLLIRPAIWKPTTRANLWLPIWAATSAILPILPSWWPNASEWTWTCWGRM